MTDAHSVKSAFLKALAHPLRLRIVEQLCLGESSVNGFVQTLGTDQPTVSRHLGILKSAGVVASRQEGISVLYTVNGGMDLFLAQLTEILRRKLRADREISRSVEIT